MLREEIFEPEERKNSGNSKKIGKYNRFTSPLKFPQLFLTVEAKVITLSGVVHNVCKGNT